MIIDFANGSYMAVVEDVDHQFYENNQNPMPLIHWEIDKGPSLCGPNSSLKLKVYKKVRGITTITWKLKIFRMLFDK